MITPAETQHPIIQMLQWLQTKLNFTPNCWMIDCSHTETAAIRAVYGQNARIFECLWHVLEAVSKQSKMKLSESNPEPGTSKAAANRKLREGACADFRRLVHAATSEEFETIWNEISTTYAAHTDWLRYLQSEWIHKKEKWALCYRQVSSAWSSWSRLFPNDYLEMTGCAALSY
jgi:hypothetical protein